MFHVISPSRSNKPSGLTNMNKSLDNDDKNKDDCKVVQEARIRWRFYQSKTDKKKKTFTKNHNNGESVSLESTMHTMRDVSGHTISSFRSPKSGKTRTVGRIGRGLFMSKNNTNSLDKNVSPTKKKNNSSRNNKNMKNTDTPMDDGEYDAYFPEDGGQFDDSDSKNIGDGEELERGAGVGTSYGILRAFPSIPVLSPKDYCKTLLSSLGYVDYRFRVLESGYNNTPTRIQFASYDNYIVQLINDKKIQVLKDCLLSGLSCNPVNVKNGDTLCHYICYTGNVAMLDTLLQCAQETIGSTSSYSPIQTCNYKGRTPLHDACSAPTLNFGVIEILLKYDPNLFFMADSNDTLPIEYIRHENWSLWIDFLQNKLPIFFPKRIQDYPTNEGDISKVRPQPIPPLASIQPNTRVCPDPPINLSIKMIELIANGTMRPSVIQFNNHNHSNDNDEDENDDSVNSYGDENDSHRESIAVSALTDPVPDYHSSFYNENDHDIDNDDDDDDGEGEGKVAYNEEYDDDENDDDTDENEENDTEMNEDDVAAFVQAFYGNIDDADDCGNDSKSVDSRLALIREIVNAPNRQSVFMFHQQMHKKK